MEVLNWPPLRAMLSGKEAAMAISPEAQYALDKCDQYLKGLPSVTIPQAQSNLLDQAQILLLRAILTEVAELRQAMAAKDA